MYDREIMYCAKFYFLGTRYHKLTYYIIQYNILMNYTVREYEPELHIVAENGLVSASVIEWTASRARRIIGRDLVAGERFYWLSKICNKSDKK